MALDEAALIDLTEAYMGRLDTVAAITGEEIRAVWLSLRHLDRRDVERFARDATPYLTAGRSEAIDLTAGYLSEVAGSRLEPIDLVGAAPDVEAPFLRHWHLLKKGEPWDAARDSGATQAEMAGYDHVQRGAADRMGKPGTKVRGYRRVLSGSACEWCQVVSTQLYKSAESARFGHHDCKCKVIAVVGDRHANAALAINKSRLSELKKSGAVSRASDARKRGRP
jgi:hypothetical protein